MAVLEHIEPHKVFRFFEEMCAIPHGSGNTKAISDWCIDFAKERGLEYHQDQDNNVIIIREAAPGYENSPAIILQGHLDMVCQQTADCVKNMDEEGLDLVLDGDFLYANGTTLGADDGIAVAMAMAVLDDPTLPSPRIEAVFTTDEEIGLLGAATIDVTPLTGRQMINLDSETEGIFTVSCAGGNSSTCIFPINRAPFAGETIRVAVTGLSGGHSGAEIHKGMANSNILMGRVLQAVAEHTSLRLFRVDGGTKDNAIPVETVAYLSVEDRTAANDALNEMGKILKNEYHVTDPGLQLTAESASLAGLPMDEDSTQKAICMLVCMPNGVCAMSSSIPNLVQTSLNLGILNTDETELQATFNVRSSVDSQKEMLKKRLVCLTQQLGGHVISKGDFSGWQYQEVSPLRDRMVQVFQEQYGKEPKIEAIHAGLECGVFAGKLPGLDCVSIGPDLFGVHTPSEKMSISSVQRLWSFLLSVLQRSK